MSVTLPDGTVATRTTAAEYVAVCAIGTPSDVLAARLRRSAQRSIDLAENIAKGDTGSCIYTDPEASIAEIRAEAAADTAEADNLDAQGDHIVWDAYSWHKTVDAARKARARLVRTESADRIVAQVITL